MIVNRRTFLGVSAATGLAGVWQPEAAAVGVRGHFPARLVEAARQAAVSNLAAPIMRVSIRIPDGIVEAHAGKQPAFAIMERFLCDVHAIVGPFEPARIVTSGGEGNQLMVHGTLQPGLQFLATTGSTPNAEAYISLRAGSGEVLLSRDVRLQDAWGMRVLASSSETAPFLYASMPPSVEAFLLMARQSLNSQKLVGH